MAAATNAKELAIRLETVDALVAKFRERWDFEEDDEKFVAEFRASLGSLPAVAKAKKGKKKAKSDSDSDESAAPKAKRPPSAYNMFVSEKRAELVAAGHKGKDLIREAAKLWNELHPKPAPAPKLRKLPMLPRSRRRSL